MKDSTTIDHVVPDTTSYAESWKAWWIKCQPPARTEEPWPFTHESRSEVKWGKLLNGGKHGVFLFVMALSWWATSLDPTASSPELAQATSDLDWVICQLTATFIVPPTSLLVPPTTSEADDTSRGKRKVKLTAKAQDGGDRVRKRFCRQ